MPSIRKTSGFSLVELSIVLVILGLLVGGVLSGRSLIRAAELRSVLTQHEQYVVAINSFRMRFNAMPGDMANATSFWGRADGGGNSGQCNNPLTDKGTGTQTCNGNGDGVISDYQEVFRFWQHLKSAALISGEFTGVHASGGTEHHVIGENCPASKISGTGWSVRPVMAGPFAGSLWRNYPNLNPFRLGRESSTSFLMGNAFTPEEAWQIDLKIDDGRPGSGSVWSRTWDTCTTATHQEDYTNAQYNVQHPSVACTLFMFTL